MTINFDALGIYTLGYNLGVTYFVFYLADFCGTPNILELQYYSKNIYKSIQTIRLFSKNILKFVKEYNENWKPNNNDNFIQFYVYKIEKINKIKTRQEINNSNIISKVLNYFKIDNYYTRRIIREHFEQIDFASAEEIYEMNVSFEVNYRFEFDYFGKTFYSSGRKNINLCFFTFDIVLNHDSLGIDFYDHIYEINVNNRDLMFIVNKRDLIGKRLSLHIISVEKFVEIINNIILCSVSEKLGNLKKHVTIYEILYSDYDLGPSRTLVFNAEKVLDSELNYLYQKLNDLILDI